MATEAKLVAALEQIVLIVRGVRVVALDTLAFQSDLVRAAWVLRQYPAMARQADPAHFGGQLFRKFRRMGTVTRRASRLHDRCVDEWFFQLLLEVSMACQTDLLLGARLQSEPAFLAFLAFRAFFFILICFRRLGRFRRLLCRFSMRLRRKTKAYYRKNHDNHFRS
jgi:hypothetical protein